MRGWFRRRKPAHLAQPARPHPEDTRIAAWHGYTPEQWATIPNHVRIAKRDSYYQARGFGE